MIHHNPLVISLTWSCHGVRCCVVALRLWNPTLPGYRIAGSLCICWSPLSSEEAGLTLWRYKIYMDVDAGVSHCMNSKGGTVGKIRYFDTTWSPGRNISVFPGIYWPFKVIAIILTIFENLKWNTRSLSLSKENYGCLLQFFSFFSFLILPSNTSYFSQ